MDNETRERILALEDQTFRLRKALRLLAGMPPIQENMFDKVDEILNHD